MDVRVPVVKCQTCGVPYVLRYSLFIVNEREPEFMYQRDCKHKTPPVGSVPLDELQTGLLTCVEPL